MQENEGNLELQAPEDFPHGWSNPPTLINLKQDYEDALPGHDAQVLQIDRYIENLNITGSAKIKTPKGRSSVQPKLIRKQAEWRYAALSEPFLSTDDIFNVEPVTFEDKEAAKQNELVLNNQFNTKLDKVKFIDEYVRTAVDEGTVSIRVGWEFKEEEREVEVPDYVYEENPEAAPFHQKLALMRQASPEKYEAEVPKHVQIAHQLTLDTGKFIGARPNGTKLVKQMVTVKNQPTAEICDYHNLIVDPTCFGNIKKAKFVIYRFETSLADLKKEGKYRNLEYVNPEKSSILGQADSIVRDDSSFNFSDNMRKRLVAYEYWGYWDVNGTGVLQPFVATWVEDVLIQLEESPFPDKELPFIREHYLPKRKSLYGEPDGALLEDNQKIIGAVTRGMIDIMARGANGQTGTRKDFLDVVNKRKFDRGEDYEYNGNVAPTVGLYQHTFSEIPQSAQVMLAMQNSDADSLTGVKAFSSGITGDGLGGTATGVRGALDAASKRELGIVRRLSSGIIQMGRKFISMNAEFLDEQEVVRITNEEFVAVRRDDLAGNFDLRLTISTAEEDERKAKELSFMLQTVGPNIEPKMLYMLMADFARLRKMPVLAKHLSEYEPQPDPVEVEKGRLEIELLKAKIAVEYSKAQENQTESQLDISRAKNLDSDTDLKNLAYVEQESGTQQERELQQRSAQANSNMNLKLLDHALKRSEFGGTAQRT